MWTLEGGGSMGDNRRAVIIGIALKPVAVAGSEGSVSEQERQVFMGVMRALRDLIARA